MVVLICGMWLVRRPPPRLSRASPPWPLLAGAVLGLPRLPQCCTDGRLCADLGVGVRADGISVLSSIGGDLECAPLRCPRCARWPAGPTRPPETVLGFWGWTGTGLAVTGAAEPRASLRMAPHPPADALLAWCVWCRWTKSVVAICAGWRIFVRFRGRDGDLGSREVALRRAVGCGAAITVPRPPRIALAWRLASLDALRCVDLVGDRCVAGARAGTWLEAMSWMGCVFCACWQPARR